MKRTTWLTIGRTLILVLMTGFGVSGWGGSAAAGEQSTMQLSGSEDLSETIAMSGYVLTDPRELFLNDPYGSPEFQSPGCLVGLFPELLTTAEQNGQSQPIPAEADLPSQPAEPQGDAFARFPELRAINAISLGEAIATESVAGEALKTPEDLAAEARLRQPRERQFVAEPWQFPRPNRNVFPFRHQPLYFEDPNLERCGISCGCLTELTSTIHFAARIPALPLLVAATPPHTRVRSLPDCPTGGHFGPEAYWPPLTPEAAAFQAAMTVGLIFLIP